ncbi:YobI family P-loop NTPase [Mycobacteroides abscessus]|uniref:YobI family P-loop NTPase n=1 Tax=Mycobacteroides abscessus TaxID=36809 RepID=UPI0002DF1B0D|nr:P-loop NTPase fold protein [Mycobacteroides abscessus]ORA26697.1 hypothetical protein BST18_15550 [Mycobacteroides abscessus subsp. bolletii]
MTNRPNHTTYLVRIERSDARSGQVERPDAASEPSATSMTAKTSAEKPLQSLTPKYEDKHHRTYLKRLEEAVKDPGNLNIALTGRYGAGKSSVLNKFEDKNKKEVLRLAISTLAPGEEGQSTTNRIQKEIVKQLLYGASEKVGKNSRFNKIAVLSRRRAFMQSAAVVLPLVGLAHMFGVLPQLEWPTAEDPIWQRLAAWATAVALVTVLGAVARLLTHGRYNVKDVSAGGAAVTLSEKPQTFFDKYIDEIVHYFEQEQKNIVLFEDLDRFDDPNIFEALRELNVLLNDTPERRKKRSGNHLGRGIARVLGWMNKEWPGRLEMRLPYPWAGRVLGLGEPLRFVYAVRDSVFSQVDATPTKRSSTRAAADFASTDQGYDEDLPATPEAELDEAAAETLRANRTKFFDIVIPLVPFISHRNARDLLVELLDERGITDIDSRLINTVAQHCTDMRLMRNMCNEYLIFAERLLEPAEPTTLAPGLDATHLFALVAYKNFHLVDFENISRRDSDLDKLYDFAQRLTRDTISAHEKRIRDLLAKPERFRQREPLAKQLGQRLELFASTVWTAKSTQYGNQWRLYRFKVGTQEFGADKVNDYDFWATVARVGSLEIVLAQQDSGGQTMVGHTFDGAGLSVFVPEALDADRWAAFDQDSIDTEIAAKECDIEMLRRADFADLLATEFMLTLRDGEAVAKKLTRLKNPGSPHTFEDLTDATLKSELARDLVRRGYIDRNYSLYAAQFYGNFTGVDVANFMVQHVQPNVMHIDYDLSRREEDGRKSAVANLLLEAEEAGEDLLNTVSAYNIDLVNYLLETGDAGAGTVARHLIATWPEEKARSFLAAYFTSKKAQREKLVELLTRCRWREVFTYLTSHDDVPTDVRVALFNAALAAFDPHAPYDLGEDVCGFLTAKYHSMSVFTEASHEQQSSIDEAEQPLSESLPQRLDVMLRRGNVVLPELAPLSDEIRVLVVEGNRYALTADNLRIALNLEGSDPVPLETLTDDNVGSETVYAYALADLPGYLAAIQDDEQTTAALTTPRTLAKVLVDMVEKRTDAQESKDQQWSGVDDLADLLARTSPSARLSNVRDAPLDTWKALAAAKLFRSSLANIEAYRGKIGSIDDHLARLLEDAATVHVDEDGDTTEPDGAECDRQAAALAILNTSALPAQVRVALVTSLGPPTPLPATDIDAESSDLFARLLEADLISDDAETFTHLRAGGWAALGPAIVVSRGVETFLSGAILDGMVANALDDDSTSAKVATMIVANVNAYVPEDDWVALQAVAVYADQHRLALDPAVVVRIARVGDGRDGRDPNRILRLLDRASPSASADNIVETFVHLGQPYNRIRNSGDSFEVDVNELHDRLLKVLQGDNRITRGYPRLPKRRYSVNVV